MRVFKLLVNMLKKLWTFQSKIKHLSIKNCLLIFRKYNLYEELARLHSSVSCFYLAIPNYLQYKKEIITTMEQAIHYSKLANKTNEYLSCLYDIAQVRSLSYSRVLTDI
jgi:hypothetical protein